MLNNTTVLLIVRIIADHILLRRMLVVSSCLGINGILFELRVLIFLELFTIFDSFSRYPLLIKSILLRGEQIVVQLLLLLSSWVLGSRPLFILVWGRFVFWTLRGDYFLAASCNFNLIRIGNRLNRFAWFLSNWSAQRIALRTTVCIRPTSMLARLVKLLFLLLIMSWGFIDYTLSINLLFICIIEIEYLSWLHRLLINRSSWIIRRVVYVREDDFSMIMLISAGLLVVWLVWESMSMCLRHPVVHVSWRCRLVLIQYIGSLLSVTIVVLSTFSKIFNSTWVKIFIWYSGVILWI